MENLLKLLNFASYRANRQKAPEISPERWERIYGNSVKAMEQQFQREREIEAVGFQETGIERQWREEAEAEAKFDELFLVEMGVVPLTGGER